MKKVVLVTGASSGIGEAITLDLLSRNYRVFAAARRLDRMAPLERAGARLVDLDLADDQMIEAAISEIKAEAGQIDVLVNNAGYGA
jgi:NADP-dependent 3-hydroxy acid dehydrogenase YdfG